MHLTFQIQQPQQQHSETDTVIVGGNISGSTIGIRPQLQSADFLQQQTQHMNLFQVNHFGPRNAILQMNTGAAGVKTDPHSIVVQLPQQGSSGQQAVASNGAAIRLAAPYQIAQSLPVMQDAKAPDSSAGILVQIGNQTFRVQNMNQLQALGLRASVQPVAAAQQVQVAISGGDNPSGGALQQSSMAVVTSNAAGGTNQAITLTPKQLQILQHSVQVQQAALGNQFSVLKHLQQQQQDQANAASSSPRPPSVAFSTAATPLNVTLRSASPAVIGTPPRPAQSSTPVGRNAQSPAAASVGSPAPNAAAANPSRSLQFIQPKPAGGVTAVVSSRLPAVTISGSSNVPSILTTTASISHVTNACGVKTIVHNVAPLSTGGITIVSSQPVPVPTASNALRKTSLFNF